jgi:hypothetical protein
MKPSRVKQNSASWKIKQFLTNTGQHISNLDAVKITGKSSAPRTMRKMQEQGIIDSYWNINREFKFYYLVNKNGTK